MKTFHLTFLTAILTLLFVGCNNDERPTVKRDGKSDIVGVEDSDKEVEAAIQTARQRVKEFIAALDAPTPGQTDFTVKFPFEENGNTEHMWIVEPKYENGQFKGILDNHPNQLPSYTYGQTVEVDASRISDWKYIQNGKIVGAFTIKAIYKNYPEADRRRLEESLGGTIDWD